MLYHILIKTKGYFVTVNLDKIAELRYKEGETLAGKICRMLSAMGYSDLEIYDMVLSADNLRQ